MSESTATTPTNTPTLAQAEAALTQAEQTIKTLEAVPAPASLTPSAALDAWLATLRDTAVARDTASYNRIFNFVQDIKTVLAAVKES